MRSIGAALSGYLTSALDTVDDAYKCLFPDRAPPLRNDDFENVRASICVFFDERMTRLDYAIYKLAVAVMFDPEAKEYIAAVRNRMLGDVPVFGKAARAATKIVDAANETVGVIHNATEMVNALLNISFHASGRAVYLLPIYRDVLEFDMRLTLAMLNERCATKGYPDINVKYLREYAFVSPLSVETPQSACDALNYGVFIFRNGNGDLDAWRAFMKQLSGTVHLPSKRALYSSPSCPGGSIEPASHCFQSQPEPRSIRSRPSVVRCRRLCSSPPYGCSDEI